MARSNASRRESVWFDSDIRKIAAFQVIGARAFEVWTRLPFLVDDDHGFGHLLPEVSVIAQDGDVSEREMVGLLSELASAGLIESFSPAPLVGSQGCYRMTTLSRRYYSFTDPSELPGEGDGDE